MLEIKGCIVTIDARGCQKKIAQKITEKGADYVLALKGNQKHFFDDVHLFLDMCIENSFENVAFDEYFETEKGHGRIETRTYYITDDISWLEGKDDWIGFRSIGVTVCTREINGVKTQQKRYHICSIEPNAFKYRRR